MSTSLLGLFGLLGLFIGVLKTQKTYKTQETQKVQIFWDVSGLWGLLGLSGLSGLLDPSLKTNGLDQKHKKNSNYNFLIHLRKMKILIWLHKLISKNNALFRKKKKHVDQYFELFKLIRAMYYGNFTCHKSTTPPGHIRASKEPNKVSQKCWGKSLYLI